MTSTATLENAWRTERLVFRAMRPDDYDNFIFDEIASDPVGQSLGNPRILSPPVKVKADEWFANFKDNLMNAMICLRSDESASTDKSKHDTATEPEKKAEPTPIGFLCMSKPGYSGPQHRSCTFGIILAKAYQNSGYGTESVNWALDWAFRRANMHSVRLGTLSFNTRAQKVYEKCGFKLDGRDRHVHWQDREWHDMLNYSILEDEWVELRKSKQCG